jgi:5-methylcytosine-specific restriction endonuclease McrA
MTHALAAFPMRAPCQECTHLLGQVETRNGQDCVFCAACGRFQYNRPRTESGREPRSLRTRPDIKPSKRARVLDRDNGCCVVCHRDDVPLDVGHLISVDEGRKLGMTDAELFDDENLAAMCAACNSGYSTLPISPRLLVSIIRARIGRRQ